MEDRHPRMDSRLRLRHLPVLNTREYSLEATPAGILADLETSAADYALLKDGPRCVAVLPQSALRLLVTSETSQPIRHWVDRTATLPPLDASFSLDTALEKADLLSGEFFQIIDPEGGSIGILSREILQRARIEQLEQQVITPLAAAPEPNPRDHLDETQRLAQIGSWELDLVNNHLWWSKETYRIFEIETDRFGASYEAFLSLVHPEDRDVVDKAYTQSVANRTPYEIKHRLLFADGSVKYVNERGTTFYDSLGRPIRSLGTVQDLTAETAQARKSSRLNAMLNALVEASSDVIFIKDQTGHYVVANQALSDLLEQPLDAVLGADDYQLFPETVARQFRHDDARIKKAGRVESYEETVIAGGEPKPYLTTKGPLMIHGKIEGVFGISRDLTPIKQSESERLRLQKQLAQNHKMEALGQLSGGIAHDFNNILAIIMGAAELIERNYADAMPATLERHLTIIKAAGSRAKNLVLQMLSFSRKAPAEAVEISLAALIEEELKLYRAGLPSSITLVEAITHVPDIQINPIEAQQLLLNLLINARDALQDKGQIEIALQTRNLFNSTCSTCHERLTGHWAELSITDSGPGIAPEIQDRLFEPFFTTKEVGQGSGMGLAVVRGIMERAKGHVMAETPSNGGTRFRLFFPIEKPFENAQAEKQSTSDSARDVPENGRVLIVDDEPDIAHFLEEALAFMGLQADCYTDSTAAVAAVEQHPDRYRLVITDQTMPKLTGIELIQKVKRIQPRLPIILLSGFSATLDEERALLAGASRFIGKPLTLDALQSAVEELLSTY